MVINYCQSTSRPPPIENNYAWPPFSLPVTRRGGVQDVSIFIRPFRSWFVRASRRSPGRLTRFTTAVRSWMSYGEASTP